MVVLDAEAGSERCRFWKALQPKGSAGSAGPPLQQYCEENAINTCCVGSHGYGAVMKGLRALVGLGSVSDFCVRRMKCCVCVVRPEGTSMPNNSSAQAEPDAQEEHVHAE